MIFNYNDEVTVYKVTSDEYGRNKIVTDSQNIFCIFLQGIRMVQSESSENIESDTIMYVDPTDQFIVDNANRLEGMFVKAPLFGIDDDEAWYRIAGVTINRDHLLTNTIDNILCVLTKSERLFNVS